MVCEKKVVMNVTAFFAYQSMQEKLPVASSLYKIIHCQKYVCRHYAQKNISDILKSIQNTQRGGIWMLDASYYEKADEIIAQYSCEERSLIPIVQGIQEEYRYLPPELLTYVAGKLGISEAKAYSVASFYENFSFEAKGKYVIKVCDGTACHVRKSVPILESLYKELGLGKKKHTTDDQLFTVETVSCLGACGLAPAVMVNDEVHPKMTPEKMSELIGKLRGEEQV